MFTWIPYNIEKYKSVLKQRIKWKFYKRKRSWNEASQLCRKEGGYLPNFTNSPQSCFVAYNLYYINHYLTSCK